MLSTHVNELVVTLNDGFTVYYDRNKQLCSDRKSFDHFSFSQYLPDSLNDIKLTDTELSSQVVSIDKIVGYHCVLSATGDLNKPWALSVFSDHTNITKVAHDLPVGVINVDKYWDAVFVNARCADMMKSSLDELYGRGWIAHLPETLAKEFQEHVKDKKQRRELYRTRIEFTSPLGAVSVFAVQLAAYFDSQDTFVNATITLTDITKEFKAESQLQYMAEHDQLTELLNRAAFIRKVEQLDNDKFNRALFVFIDLDKFKEINDSFGHKFGDRVLETVARRIRAVVREQDLTARFGGDEFVICMPSIRSDKNVEVIAKKVSAALNRSATVEGKELYIGSSIGIAWTPTIQFDETHTRAEMVQAVLDAADQGMYEVKKGELTSEHFKIYDVNLREQRRWLSNQKKELSLALEMNQITSHFQPIYDLNGDIVSVEALARFTKPFEYFKNIEEVISFAKRSNLDEALFSVTLNKAIEGFAGLISKNPGLNLNLNVDVSQLEEKDFVKTITELCLNHKIPFTQISIEVTEMMLERNSARVELQIRQLARRGFLISMDDFGTGYSSFKRLMNYSFHELKIDRFFISHITDDEKFRKTLRAMIAIGQSLDLQILAEGIETREQFAFCKELGVNLFQGYYFSRPLEAAVLSELMKQCNLTNVEDRKI